MRIGIISDTYVPGAAMGVPQQVVPAFKGVDLILHCGNSYVQSVLDWLERIAPVMATGAIRAGQAEAPQPLSQEGFGDPRVARIRLLEMEGHSIGMVHDLAFQDMDDRTWPGSLGELHRKGRSPAKMAERFFGAPVSIVIFGRTLASLVEEHEGVLFINPGSPSVPNGIMKLGSVAVLDLTPGKRNARLIELATIS